MTSTGVSAEVKTRLEGVDDLTAWVETEIKKGSELFERHRFGLVHKHLDQVVKQLEPYCADSDDQLSSAARKLTEEVLKSREYELAKSYHEESDRIYKELQSDEGWDTARESDGIKTCYRVEKDEPTHTFKLSGVIDGPVQNLVAVLYELELMHNWVPLLKYSKELKKLNQFRKICQCEVSVPWPYANRDIVADAFGVDMLEENKVFIIIKPLDPAIALDHPVNNSDGVVRARVIRGGFLIEPLSENQCRFYLIFNFDAYLAVLPIWLLNWFTGKLVHYIVVRLRRAVHFDDKSEYPARIKRDPDFYNYVEEIVRQHNSKDRQV